MDGQNIPPLKPMTSNITQKEKQLAVFCEEVLRATQARFDQVSSSSHQIRLAETVFQFNIHNPAMAEIILPPLEHLQVSKPQPSEIDIFILDGAFTGVDLPDVPWDKGQFPATATPGSLDGETILYRDNKHALAFKAPRQHLSIADISGGRAVFWVPDIDHLYPLDGRPLRAIFQWFLDRGGYQIVHAAGVGFQHGGLIIAGKSGAGKSTIAVACLNSSLPLAGDDNVILSTLGPSMVYSLYNSANLDHNSISLLPFFEERKVPVQEHHIDKVLFYLYKNFPDRIISHFPLKAIVVSQIEGKGPSSLKPLSAAAALTALAPTSIFQVPGNKQTAFSRISQIVRQTPCYQLTIGASVDNIPPLLTDLISHEEMLNG